MSVILLRHALPRLVTAVEAIYKFDSVGGFWDCYYLQYETREGRRSVPVLLTYLLGWRGWADQATGQPANDVIR
jgi:hypothetical protein